MKLGIDVGNSTTCVSNGVIFNSKVAKINRELSEEERIKLGGETFYLEQGQFDSEYRKVKKPSYIKLLFGAMCKSIKSDTEEVELGIGLPLNQYKEDKDLLKERIEENRILQGIYKKRSREFFISKVNVYPEGVLATEANYEGIVIDIGGRTTDVCLIQQQNGIKKILKPTSIGSGVINLQTEFINLINSRYGLNLIIDDFDRILKNGLEIYGKQQDISFAVDVFKIFLEDLLLQVDQEYSLKINKTCFMGGGSILLKSPILKRVEGAVVI
ncbi:MAG: hypothetical protein ACRCX8_13490, partial [Sarcina sp.]